MKIQKDKVVEIHYKMYLANGEMVETTEGEPALPYLHGSEEIPLGLQAALCGHSVGAHLKVTVEPAQGFGLYDEELVIEFPLDALPEGSTLEEGDEIYLEGEHGEEIPAFIEHISHEGVLVNYNHPLAGEKLIFDVRVLGVRDATPEELAHGHAHDEHGGHHEHD